MGFTNPIMLWALTGIGLPVVIHLLSRKQAGVVYVGSLRHLHVSFSKQFKSIRLNEIVLLILRVVMIIILTLILAGTFWKHGSTGRKWLVVEPGAEKGKQFAGIADSLQRAGYELHYLTSGFPGVNAIAKPEPTKSYESLSNELSSVLLSEAIVLYFQRATAFRGHRITLPANQHWIAVDLPSADYPVRAARKIGSDSIDVRIGHTSREKTSFDNHRYRQTGDLPWYKLSDTAVDSVKVSPPARKNVAIVSDDAFDNDRQIMGAALKTLQQAMAAEITISELSPVNFSPAAKFDAAIWLSSKAVPKLDTGLLVSFRNEPGSDLLLQRSANHWLLTRHLNNEISVQESLVLSLGRIIDPETTVRELALRKDRRVVNASPWSGITETDSNDHATMAQLPSDDQVNVWMGLFLIIFIAERTLSGLRNQ